MTDARTLARSCGLPRLEARMLLEHVLQKPREWLLAHDTDALDVAAVAHFGVLAARRRDGMPMAYIVGWREFMGRRFAVSPATLIPRPDTELLVEAAIQRLRGVPEACVLDMGTGSGAIAVSVALAAPQAAVTATDASEPALEVARHNARALGAHIECLSGDWYGALADGRRFDLILANPPYIANDDAHLDQGDLRYEPRSALTDETDGLGALRTIAIGAAHFLKPGGALWVEHGYDQSAAVRDIFRQAGLRDVGSRRDLAGIERITGGSL